MFIIIVSIFFAAVFAGLWFADRGYIIFVDSNKNIIKNHDENFDFLSIKHFG